MDKEAIRLKNKYPERVPVIACKHKDFLLADKEDKQKYLVPMDITIGQFIFIIRRKIRLNENKALFLFFNDNTSVSNTLTINECYNIHKNKDGFLYCTYSSENTFG